MHTAPVVLRGSRTLILQNLNIPFVKRKVLGCSTLFSLDYCTSVNKKLPEVRGLPLIGSLLSLMMAGGMQKLHEYVDKRHRQLGPIYKEWIGPVPAVFVNSPDDFRRIFYLEGPKPQHFLPESWVLYNEIRAQRRGLLFMDGDEWLYFRRILNKVMLTPDITKQICVPCQEAAENLTQKWKIQSQDGGIISNLGDQLYQWSIEVLLAAFIGSQWHDCKQQMECYTEKLATTLHCIFEYSSVLSIIPARLAMKLNVPAWRKFVETADTALKMLNILVPKMIQLGGDGLLRKMMDNGIMGDDIIRIVADFIMAAGDTTAITIQWIMLLLSDQPDLQQKLFEDLRDLSPLEITRHQLLNGVIKESLRLHPVAPFITRYVPEDSYIRNYLITKGELLILSIYSSGRDAQNFPQPNEFRPERWIRKGRENRYQGVINPHASLPFAMGARSCIGRKIAETQLCLALVQLIKNFKIECINRNNVNMILHLVSVPSKPIKLKLTERRT